ncbi:MAG: biopolymer transporter ExbD [Microscillaceae bacterium]|nr:biopolymer transporter ExbD [Microscillaceae bacterium]
MAKFSKKKNLTPVISTASLPDIVFMLLFFFMVITRMREDNPLVKTQMPQATQIQEIQKQTPLLNLYIGKPKQSQLGTEPRIFAEGKLIEAKQIPQVVEEFRSQLPENQRNKLLVNLKIDYETGMGIINDVKIRLREAEALRINYQAVNNRQLAKAQ